MPEVRVSILLSPAKYGLVVVGWARVSLRSGSSEPVREGRPLGVERAKALLVQPRQIRPTCDRTSTRVVLAASIVLEVIVPPIAARKRRGAAVRCE